MAIPADNKPLDLAAEIELGRHLFYDKAMSVDNSTSCASCHQAGNGFSDNLPVSMGFNNQHGTRNAPTLTNIGFNTAFTWDGRFPSLEKHAPGPIFNSLEMGNNFSTTQRDTTPSDYNSGPGSNDTLFLFSRLDGGGKTRKDSANFQVRTSEANQNSMKTDLSGKNYYALLNAAWGPVTIQVSDNGGGAIMVKKAVAFTMDIIAKSIAAFERTMVSTQSAFDRYNRDGDQTAITDDAKEGFKIFIDPAKGNCVSCHSGYNFTDQQYHNNGINGADGISNYPIQNDLGRADISKSSDDNYKFKTPTLRNVGKTAPWMHDGRFPIGNNGVEMGLEDIIRRNYDRKNPAVPGQDPRVKPLGLTGQEIAYLGAFLMTLGDDNFANANNPAYMNPWNN